MIPTYASAGHGLNWQTQLAKVICEPAALLALLGIDPPVSTDEFQPMALGKFPMRVTRAFAERMTVGDRDDPLLRQVLPQRIEDDEHAGFGEDPLGEDQARMTPILLRKYAGRALLLTTTRCAIHCRYCFRRHRREHPKAIGKSDWSRALDLIRQDPTLAEIILSGGDPLTLSNAALAWLASQLARIPHVQRLRIHTRIPIVLPARIDTGLLDWLGDTRLRTAIVVHCNHPQEIDAQALNACLALRRTGSILLNQSVLLADINDHSDVLIALSERLFEAGVLPYYLHLLDPVHGAAHYAVDVQKARVLRDKLRTRLPGYLLPRFVREVPGQSAKCPL